MGGGARHVARARPADLPGPVPRPRTCRTTFARRFGRPRVRGDADLQHRPATVDGAPRARRRRREVVARQRGLAPRQHLHAGAGQGRRLLRRDRAVGRGGHRAGPTCAPPTRRSTTRPANASPGSAPYHSLYYSQGRAGYLPSKHERQGRVRPVRLPRHGHAAAAAGQGASRHRPPQPADRPPRPRHRRHGSRSSRRPSSMAQRVGLPGRPRCTTTSGRSATP